MEFPILGFGANWEPRAGLGWEVVAKVKWEEEASREWIWWELGAKEGSRE